MTLRETQFEGGRQRAFRAHVLGQLVHRREEGADAVGQARRHTGAGPRGGTPGSPRPTPAGCCCRARLSNSPGSAPQSSFRRPPRNYPTGNQHLRHHQRLLMALSWALHSAVALSADSLLCLPRPGLLGGEWQALGGGVGGGGSEEQAGPALCRLCTGVGGGPAAYHGGPDRHPRSRDVVSVP